MPSFAMFFLALLFIGAIWWVWEVLGRWREDLSELRHPQAGWISRLVIIAVWVATVFIALWLLSWALRVAAALWGWWRFLHQYHR